MNKKSALNLKVYKSVVWILLVVGIIVLIQISPILSRPENILADDFFHFWVGGHQNALGKNPFDPLAVEQFRTQLGITQAAGKTSVMLNPPWAITIFMPFGLLNYPLSRLLWLILSVSAVLLSSLLLWQIYSTVPRLRWLGIVLMLIFASTISVLEKGQLTVLVLLGLVLFLYGIVKKQSDWLVGASLTLVSLKPQVVLLFWLAVLFWVIQKHKWMVLISAASCVVILSLLAFLFNPAIFSQYAYLLQSYGISEWANPTIGAYLRFFWFGLDNFWLQYLPALIGAVWFLYYWIRHRKAWDWMNAMPILMLASILTSPYAWTYDQVVLAPAVIQAVAWVATAWRRILSWIVAIAYLALNLLNLILHRRLDDFWFIWFAPAVVILYILARWQYSASAIKISQTSQVNG